MNSFQLKILKITLHLTQNGIILKHSPKLSINRIKISLKRLCQEFFLAVLDISDIQGDKQIDIQVLSIRDRDTLTNSIVVR